MADLREQLFPVDFSIGAAQSGNIGTPRRTKKALSARGQRRLAERAARREPKRNKQS